MEVEEGAAGRERILVRRGLFKRHSEDLSGGTKTMLDARELPASEGMGEAAPEIDPAPDDAIRPSGT